MGGSILTREELRQQNPLKNYYQEKISDFIKFNNLDEVIVCGCSYGHEAYYIHEDFPHLSIIACDIDEKCIDFCKGLNLEKATFFRVNLENKYELETFFANCNKNSGIICFETFNFFITKGS